ncbi:MAG TPA: calcium-binding protein, partial [Aquabacterium sp.]|nr:calcium-binding protein [Aquabacterium sp.]
TDQMQGGAGNDQYFAYGAFGNDVIADSAGQADALHFVTATRNHLWLSQLGNDLKIAELGSSNSITIQGWFSASGNQLETIVDDTSGYTLNASAVSGLVSAMAQFTPQDLSGAQAPSQLVAAYNSAWIQG